MLSCPEIEISVRVCLYLAATGINPVTIRKLGIQKPCQKEPTILAAEFGYQREMVLLPNRAIEAMGFLPRAGAKPGKIAFREKGFAQ